MRQTLKTLLGPRTVRAIKRWIGQPTPPPIPRTEGNRKSKVESMVENGGTASKTIATEIREKWQEVPTATSQGGRLFSGDLLRLEDQAFLSCWQEMFQSGCSLEHRGWYQLLYRDAFSTKKVLEVGSGLGFDGLFFLQHGAVWTFADIVEDNLRVIERVCRLLGLRERADFLYIQDISSFDALTSDFDVIWCNGSLHHVPFATARAECLHILPHLRARGRWIELAYPYERWVREGSKPFTEWGKMTDGERTPWAEWYDVEKLKRRLFPARLSVVLNFNCYGDAMSWMDLVLDSAEPVQPERFQDLDVDRTVEVVEAHWMRHNTGRLRSTPAGISIETPPAIWSYAAGFDLQPPVAELIPEEWKEQIGFAIDIECTVHQGTIGFAATDASKSTFVVEEKIAAQASRRQRVTIPIRTVAQAHTFLIRNTSGHGSSRITIHKASLRLSM